MNDTQNVNNQNTENNAEENATARPNLEIPTVARRPAAPNVNPFSMGNSMGAFGSSNSQPTTNNSAQPSMSMMGHNSAQNSDNERRLVIGEGITISGEINSCEYLVVEGKVKSDFKSSNRLDISETGEFKGSAEVEEATIAGEFDGTLTVSQRLTVRSTARITGTIYYGELAVEGGAVIEGKIATIAKKTDSNSDKSKKAEKKEAKKDNKDSDNVAQMQLATG